MSWKSDNESHARRARGSKASFIRPGKGRQLRVCVQRRYIRATRNPALKICAQQRHAKACNETQSIYTLIN